MRGQPLPQAPPWVWRNKRERLEGRNRIMDRVVDYCGCRSRCVLAPTVRTVCLARLLVRGLGSLSPLSFHEAWQQPKIGYRPAATVVFDDGRNELLLGGPWQQRRSTNSGPIPVRKASGSQ